MLELLVVSDTYNIYNIFIISIMTTELFRQQFFKQLLERVGISLPFKAWKS